MQEFKSDCITGGAFLTVNRESEIHLEDCAGLCQQADFPDDVFELFP